MIRVSVVVPTYQRPALLARCLAALAAQEFEGSAFEVIVVDDAASEATRRQVREADAVASAGPREFPSRGAGMGLAGEAQAPRTSLARDVRRPGNGPAIHYLAVTGRHGPAAARNVGWRAARGEVVAFTDDDCVPDREWLAQGVAALAAGLDAATGRVVVPLPGDPTDYERDAAGLEGAEFVTANCFCRREALVAVGGFDERFAAAWREDSDLHFALIEAGREIGRVPGAVVVHPVRPAPWGVCLRQQRKSLFDALLFKKHPALYRERIRSSPPWDYYAIVASLGVAILAAALGHPRPVLAAASVWAFMTGRFCVRRLRGTSRTPRHVAEMVATSALIPPLSVFWRLYGASKYRVLFL